jgi:hypothetical protein
MNDDAPTLDYRPRLARLSHVAEALDLTPDTLRGMEDAGTIDYLQSQPQAMRYVPLHELERLEADGWEIDWDVLTRLARVGKDKPED